MSYNTLADRSYTLYLASGDKVSGSNNNATFNIDWSQLLPVNYNEYKMIWSFQTTGSYYKDTAGTAIYSTAKVAINFGCRQFSYDAATRTPSNTIGYITRDQQTTTSASNILSAFYYQFPAKTMMRPSNNAITLTVTNMYSGLPFVTTDNAGVAQSDMSSWQMAIEFIPIDSSLRTDIQFQNL